MANKEIYNMKKFKVPFLAGEIAWNCCEAIVEAASKEEAFAMVKKSIEESNPYADFNADWDGINTVTDSVSETLDFVIGEDYFVVDNVEEVNELEVMFEFDAFDLLRLEKDAIYDAVEQQLDGVEVKEMEMIPVKVSGSNVTYKCVPTDYTREFQIHAYFFDENSSTPYGSDTEEMYTIHAKTKAEALVAAKDMANASEYAVEGITISVEVE